jgi:hypothetical protein
MSRIITPRAFLLLAERAILNAIFFGSILAYLLVLLFPGDSSGMIRTISCLISYTSLYRNPGIFPSWRHGRFSSSARLSFLCCPCTSHSTLFLPSLNPPFKSPRHLFRATKQAGEAVNICRFYHYLICLSMMSFEIQDILYYINARNQFLFVVFRGRLLLYFSDDLFNKVFQGNHSQCLFILIGHNGYSSWNFLNSSLTRMFAGTQYAGWSRSCKRNSPLSRSIYKRSRA